MEQQVPARVAWRAWGRSGNSLTSTGTGVYSIGLYLTSLEEQPEELVQDVF